MEFKPLYGLARAGKAPGFEDLNAEDKAAMKRGVRVGFAQRGGEWVRTWNGVPVDAKGVPLGKRSALLPADPVRPRRKVQGTLAQDLARARRQIAELEQGSDVRERMEWAKLEIGAMELAARMDRRRR